MSYFKLLHFTLFHKLFLKIHFNIIIPPVYVFHVDDDDDDDVDDD